MRVDRFIPRLAVAAIVAAVVVVSATAIAGWWQIRVAANVLSYPVGDTIDIPRELYAGASETVVVFVRDSCPVCQAEAPQIVKLSTTLTTMPVRVPTIVVTGSTQVEADRAFAARLGNVTHEHLSFNTLRVRTVPTIVLVNRQGTVLFSQEGRSKTSNVLEELIRRIPSR